MSYIGLACFPLTQADEEIVATDGYSWPIPNLPVGVETADGKAFLFFGKESGLLGKEDYKKYAKKYQVIETAHSLWNQWQQRQTRIRVSTIPVEQHQEEKVAVQPTQERQVKALSGGINRSPATEDSNSSPEPKPIESTSREVGPFLVDEVQYNDGSLRLQISDNSFSEGTMDAGCYIPPEQAEDYKRRASEVTSGCVPTREGGQFCFEILDACEKTFYRLYDASGAAGPSGVVGGIFTYEDYKWNPD